MHWFQFRWHPAAVLWILGLAFQANSVTSPAHSQPETHRLPRSFRLPFEPIVFDLHSESELRRLKVRLDQLAESTGARYAARQSNRLARLNAQPIRERTAAELRTWYQEQPGGWLGKKERRALLALRQIAENALTNSEPAERTLRIQQLFEIAAAIENFKKPAAPVQVDFVQAPLLLWKYFRAPIAKGSAPARNLPRAESALDLSQVQPPNSSFWTQPERVETDDLYLGFGRPEPPAFEATVWEYSGPKTGFGTSPGFEVHSGRLKLKVKFAETHSEPFAARIFSSLGYHVEPTDHVPYLQIRYDRRLFLEFDVRREVCTRVTTFLIPSATIRIQKRFDPFACISAAVLRDGRRITSAELKKLLLRESTLEHPEAIPGNFNAEMERSIDYLLTVPANVHSDARRAQSVGVWDFGQLDHADRRELRGLGILAGWLGWFDCRPLNTRLEMVGTEGDPRLRHAITDLGSCLGDASALFSRHCELPNEFPWTFTLPRKVQGQGRMTVPFRLIGFRPIEAPEAFTRMTRDDARWMGRWIGRLTKDQLGQALIAAGFDSSEARLYCEKLVHRRDRLILDLDLESEVPLLREAGTDRGFSYNPSVDGPFEVARSDGDLRAPLGNSVIQDGLLVGR